MNWNLTNALDLLHQQFPNAFVTSGTRNPNSKLGRANPRSYHNHGQAFDIRPMPGVDFNDYVAALKAQGLPVIEALDEAKNPKPWTTGPNWHVAFGAGPIANKESEPMLTPEQRAQMFNVALPPQEPGPMDERPSAPAFDIQQAMTGISLPQADPKSSKGFDWRMLLGVLGDAYIGANGGQTIYGPAMARKREQEDERNFEREKLQAQLAARRQELEARLSEPPAFVQNAQAWQHLDLPTKLAVLQQQDAVNPINVATPQGTQNIPRTSTKVINGKTYYKIGNDWFEEGE
jgi:hypothetical protein